MAGKVSNNSLKILVVLYSLYICIVGGLYFAGMFDAGNTVEVSIFMFASMLILMSTGLPIAFCLATVAIITAWIFEPNLVNMLLFQFKDFTLESGKTLICIPLFIFMGFILHSSGIAKDLFDAVYLWAGGLRGGLGMGTVLICAIMAAMIGVSSAATLSMGIIAVPAMLSRNYDKQIATGIVQAGGALGFLIPPSIMMIMYAFVAQESVGRLFAAGLVPGIMLATMYVIYIGIRAYLHPDVAPALPAEDRGTFKDKVVALKYLVLPSCIILGVLGCIFTGVTSPTEAAALGAAGAMICAAIRRNLTFKCFKESLMRTLSLSGFNAYIILGAIVFSAVYSGLGASSMIREALTGMNVSPWVVVVMMQLSFFLLGMFLDDIAILFLCMPIYVPIIKALGLDPVWFAVLYVMNMQMAYITPPYGLNLFYMKAVAPKEITLNDIYRSIVPFLFLQAVGLILLLVFPQIALWLPSLIFDYLQMLIYPDLLFSKLDVIIQYPGLYKVLISNPQMLFDAGNMTNILNNSAVADVLFNNHDFSSFLLNSSDFVKMLVKEDWLVQLPQMNEFLQHHQQFLQDHQQIKLLMQ
ncbi:TRAP transporter large permease [Desulforhopalus singaporensis]|uniref:TRAP transporter, DctM subunit n=1 Tax=Desulforhopalus singaporensis TaxID=91360 RepID=A0A1H0N9W9_9BACT|nr:TRAP transporter large permease subunit [Desulforhopalus singaporensis]SDO89458.1 TRAP transporter, DctM subunit [Desulforhopalus singaporensis]